MMPSTTNSQKTIAVIGGGAAGFFAAITAAEADPTAKVVILEKGNTFLTKVKVSGGGRCNVTHACFDPALLATHYPRGSRELRASFHRWQPNDTIEWFSQRNVELKTEPDGRMFPITDSSQTIIDCFLSAARLAGVQLERGMNVREIHVNPEGGFKVELATGAALQVDKVCITSGSLKSSPLTQTLEKLGHHLEPLVPSLFAFNISDPRLDDLAGLSVQQASVKLLPKSAPQLGPILITHRGLSGPAILRLSAWEARKFHDFDYQVQISINWLGQITAQDLQATFATQRSVSGKALVKNKVPIGLPRRLWERFLKISGIAEETQWAQLTKEKGKILAQDLTDCRLLVTGKTTNKDEFVTCGGIRLGEVNFRTMESRVIPGLHFAGECLDIDGITGGFNFQAAWTTGRIAGLALAEPSPGEL